MKQKLIAIITAFMTTTVVITTLIPLPKSLGQQLQNSQEQFQQSPRQLVDEVWQIVNRQYFDADFNRQNWEAVRQQYVNRSYNSLPEAYTAIRQMLQKLNDPLTRFMDPEEFKNTQLDPGGVGIGLDVNQGEKTKLLAVISVLEETPAYNAGILVGDILIKIDGQDIQGMNAPVVMNRLRGASGTPVVLTILRGQKQLEFKITREREKVAPVRYRAETITGKKIGYIRLNQFGASAGKEMYQAIKDLEKQGVNGYILDLRSNPGGLLFSSVEIVRMWINKGTIVSTVKRNNKIERKQANGRALTNKPLVVIVNQGTASGAEIFAGALQDNNRGVLVGSKTLGLNTIQSIRPLENGSGVAVTIAKWLTPKGRDINKIGILPDVVVNLTQAQQLAMVQQRSFGTMADPQYSKSQEKLKQLISNNS
jgi:carboxyl-terminal processing protease